VGLLLLEFLLHLLFLLAAFLGKFLLPQIKILDFLLQAFYLLLVVFSLSSELFLLSAFPELKILKRGFLPFLKIDFLSLDHFLELRLFGCFHLNKHLLFELLILKTLPLLFFPLKLL